MDIYFMFWVIIQYYFIYLDAPAVVIGSFFSWLLYPFGILPSLWIFFFSTSLPSDTPRCSRFTLSIPFPSPRISHFPKDHIMIEFVFTHAI